MDEYKNTRKTHHITFDDADVNQQNPLKMSKHRNIIQLLEMVKTQIENDTRIWHSSNGICDVLNHLMLFGYINGKEYYLITDYLKNNTPQNLDFGPYWFKPRLAQPRLDWINEQIQRLQKEQQAL